MDEFAEIGIRADTSDLSTAGRKLDDLGRRGDRVEKRLASSTDKMGASFTKVAVGVAAVGTALASLTAVATRGPFVEFNRSLSEVNTLTAGTSINIDKLADAARRQAAEFGTQPVEQTRAFYQIISAGASDAAEATDILTASNRLAVGGVTDIATAAGALSSVLNVYGREMTTAADVSDTLFVAMKAGQTTVGELASSLGSVTPLAKPLNVSLQQTAAAVSALTKGGIETTVAVNGLRAILAAIARPQEKAIQLSEQLGVEFNAAGLEAKGFADFMRDLVERTGGSVDQLGQLFGGVEALVPILALAGTAGDDFEQILADMESRAGSTTEAFDIMAASPGFKSDQLMAALSNAAIGLGAALSDTLTPALEGVTKLLNDFSLGDLPLTEVQQQVQLIQSLESDLASLNDRRNIPVIGDLVFSRRDADLLEQRIEDARDDLDKMRQSVEETADAAVSSAEAFDDTEDAIEDVAKSTESLTSSTKELTRATEEEIAAERERNEILAEADRVIRSIETADQRLARETDNLNRLLQAGLLDWNQYQRAVQQAKGQLQDLPETVDEAGRELSQFSIQAARNIETAFANSFFDAFDGRTENMVDTFANALKRMVANALSADLLNALLGTRSAGGIGSLTGLFGGLFGGFGGSSGGGGSAGGTFDNIPGLLGSGGSAAQFGGLSSLGGVLSAGALSIGIGSALAGDKRLFGQNGTVTSTIGTVLGAALGPVGGILGPLAGGLFGRGPLKLQDSLIRGTVTDEGIGGDFLTNTRFKAKGGLLRGNKVDNVTINANTGELITGAPGIPESGISGGLGDFAGQASQDALTIGRLFDETITGFNESLRESADLLGIGTQSLDNFRTFLQLTSDGAEAITEEDVAKALADVGNQMATALIPGLEGMLKAGESAVQGLQRISLEFASLENAATVLGSSTAEAREALARLSISARTELVEAAGGVEALNSRISFFANNFLDDQEKVALQTDRLNDELKEFGLTADLTREQYKTLVESVTQAGGASVELASTLLALGPQFLALKDAQDRLASSATNATGAVSNLAADIAQSFGNIDAARAAVVTAENELAVAEARNTLSNAQSELSQASSALSSARSALSQAENAEQSRLSAEINNAIQARNELISSYQAEANVLRTTASRFDALATRISDFRTSLDTSELSPFTPGEQLNITRQRFNETRRLAAAGDQDALDRLPRAAEDFLRASQTFNASNDVFESDFLLVRQVLQEAGVTARDQRDIATDQLSGLEDQIIELQEINEATRDSLNHLRNINDGVVSVGQATRDLEAAQGRFSSAQEAVRGATSEVENAVRQSGGFINDVERAVNKVELAVLQLAGAVLQGPGNPNISAAQIQDFVRANPTFTDQQFAQQAIASGINNQQLFNALGPLGVTPQRINTATRGASVGADTISRIVDEKLAQGDFIGIYNAAIANGISKQRLARDSALTVEQIDQFIRAQGLPEFHNGTDFVNRTGLAVLERGEAVTPASHPERLRAEVVNLRKDINSFRKEQVDQMSVLVTSNIRANNENARQISKANQRLAAATPWMQRVADGTN